MHEVVVNPRIKVLRPFCTSVDWLSNVAVKKLFGEPFANWFYEHFKLLPTDSVTVTSVIDAKEIYDKYIADV